ncbi:MAG TPA: ATP-binding cassette domain-containing protein [Fimbriimonadaceae bacterium]|nr:ATP-binding cassette domain-containing protein [Fimbriimonadaceae bacterium]HRJ97460.1 ATP-binding cassette domain-containing protein [Fimbriimonadaceae bacterium]
MPVIEAIDLAKTYVSNKKQPGIWGGIKALFSRQKTYVEAVKGITLSVEQGELVGFLGPNGAGKTTTLKMLTGILYPTSGQARVLGFRPFDRNPNMLRQISLVMGNKNQLWWDLPAWDSFVVLRELYDVDEKAFKERVDYLVEALQITDKINQQVRKLSLGERMKCELVAALLHAPKVVFLDEPTIGLDLVSQKRIRDFLLDLNRREGSTVILTSHYMQDVEEVCDRVVVIDHGALIFDGTLDSLTAAYSDSKRLRLTFENGVPAEELAFFGEIVESEEGCVVLAIPSARTAAITGEILQRFPVSDVAIEAVSVEEVVRNLFSGSAVTNVPRETLPPPV